MRRREHGGNYQDGEWPGIASGTWSDTRSGSVPSWTTTLQDAASNDTVIDFCSDYAGDYYETERKV